ncbi:MAG: bifunctional folylpolyglutamate synthase/dihydrofolate synthase, partial [Gammaproteobacteria bacterium]|nr:bifunctional folylpolyglutamate synthase/dihydrofolate synthase [Gammaproteobacteria bacterium]
MACSIKTLEQWLAWQEQLHPEEIELGLERCGRVAGRMNWPVPPFPILIIAGTNGKGSSVIMLEAILLAAGYRTGIYISPHIRRYNERVRLSGEEVTDAALCTAFERIDRVRTDTSLTYFEFGTLAAMDVFY